MRFKEGQKVEHVLNKEYLLVLEEKKTNDDTDKIRVVCRTKDMRSITFYEFELRESKYESREGR